ncbi:hypothetical protein [Gracilibacillus ureilyticus]|uniref:hypothetical protein n=1 Tax=Gracilibacillus ureilyticus TaxID=531814 RepID=UPI001587C0DF|nr:hypothetical protein [Gracilibacillus ureilyticus]
MLKESSGKKKFFNLPKEDEIHFTLEEKEKEEKEQVVNKVFQELDKKYQNDK